MSQHRAQPLISVPFMFLVYAALMCLLALTIFAAHVSLGLIGLAIALAIAATKAILVLLYYMHVRIESPATRLFAVAGFVWLFIMILLTTADYVSRPWLNRTEPLPNSQTSEIFSPPPGATAQTATPPQPITFTPR